MQLSCKWFIWVNHKALYNPDNDHDFINFSEQLRYSYHSCNAAFVPFTGSLESSKCQHSLVDMTGFEPATFRFVAGCSIQLSYTSKNFRQMSTWCSGVDGSRTHVQKPYSHRKLYQHLSPILPGTGRMVFLHAGFVAKTAYWWACGTSLSLQASLRRFLSSWHPVIHPIRRVAEWTAFEEVVS